MIKENIVVVGAQWGDEGKGRIIDLLSEKFNIIVRFQGGSNAGHTIIVKDKKIVLHHIPSGVLRKGKISVIGNGTVIDPSVLVDEIKQLRKKGYKVSKNNLKISNLAHLILPHHKALDKGREIIRGKNAIGTTGRGIGPCYEDKISRQGIRFIDLQDKKSLYSKLSMSLNEKNKILVRVFKQKGFTLKKVLSDLNKQYKYLKEFVTDTEDYLQKASQKNKSILFEGAQGVMLDIDFGTYPFVTSSSTISANASIGTGIPYSKITKSIGISNSYTTRVVHVTITTEMLDDKGLTLREFGAEDGATSGRPRRCGWLDLVALKHSVNICGLDQLVITKADILSMFDTIKLCTGYKIGNRLIKKFPQNLDNLNKVVPVYKNFKSWKSDDLNKENPPKNLINFIKYIENYLNVEISMVSVGPERDQILYL